MATANSHATNLDLVIMAPTNANTTNASSTNTIPHIVVSNPPTAGH